MQKKTCPAVRNAKKASAKKVPVAKDGGRWVTSDGGSKLYIAEGGDVHAGGPKGPVIVGSTLKKKGGAKAAPSLTKRESATLDKIKAGKLNNLFPHFSKAETAAVMALESKGIVKLTPDKDDDRSFNVSLRKAPKKGEYDEFLDPNKEGNGYIDVGGLLVKRGSVAEKMQRREEAKKKASSAPAKKAAKVSEYGKTKAFDKNDVVMVKDGDEEFSGKVLAKTAKGWKLDVSGDIPGSAPIEVKASNLKYLRKGKPTKKKPNTGHKLPYYD